MAEGCQHLVRERFGARLEDLLGNRGNPGGRRVPCGRSAPVFASEASLIRRFTDVRRRFFDSCASKPAIKSVMVIPRDFARESSTSSVGAERPLSNSDT